MSANTPTLASTFIYRLAQHTPSHQAQQQILQIATATPTKYPTLRSSLALNEHLTPELWDTLRATGAPLGSLLRNPPDATRARLILSDISPDDRVEALKFSVKNLDEQTLQQLLDSPFFDPHHAAASLISHIAPPALARKLWESVITSEVPKLDDPGLYPFGITPFCDVLESVLLNYDILDDSELLQILLDPDMLVSLIYRIFDIRPSLIPLLINHPNNGRLLGALSPCRHLDEPTATYLLNAYINSGAMRYVSNLAYNPSLPRLLRISALNHLIASIDEPVTPDQYPNTQLDEYQQLLQTQLAALASNTPPVAVDWQSATGSDLEEVKVAVLKMGSSFHTTFYPTQKFGPIQVGSRYLNDGPDEDLVIVATVSTTLEQLGAASWGVFLSLLEDWHSTLYELLELTTSIIRG